MSQVTDAMRRAEKRPRLKTVIPGYRDIYCQVCGFGPRANLSRHVINEHDGVAAYKEQYGRYSLTSVGYRAIRETVWEDAVADGVISAGRRQRTCKNGHVLTVKTTYVVTTTRGNKSWTGRACRQCALDRATAQKDVQAPEPLVCEWCNTKFTPIRNRKNTRFCCPEHGQLFRNARNWERERERRDATAEPVQSRLCDWCSKSFIPHRTCPRQRFCCKTCSAAFHYAARSQK